MHPGTAVVAGSIGLSVTANFLTDLVRLVFSRATGRREEVETEALGQLNDQRGGELDALVDASEPAIRAAHNIINHGALTININNINSGRNAASLDKATKSYVWENVINNNPQAKIFSVSSFSSNSKTGRVFDFEEGRSLSFELASEIDEESLEAVLDSHNNYARTRILSANDLRSAIGVKFTAVEDRSGRLKKIRILKARRSIQLL